MEVQRESQERIQVSVEADVDPTVNPVDWSFVDPGERPTTWVSGLWLPAVESGGVWTAVARSPIIGAGALDLDPDRYGVFIRITTGTEIPVLLVGSLRVR